MDTLRTSQLERELNETRAKLAEAEETLRALSCGEVDAVVVEGENGPHIYTLKSAAEPYRMLVEQMHEGALTVSSQGVILYCNEALAGIVGKASKDMVGSTVLDLISKRDFEDLAPRSGSAGRETVLKKAGGGQAAVFMSSAPLHVEGQDLISIVVTDLTRQHLRLRYETIIESVTQPVYALTPDLIIESWNPGAEKAYGYTPDEIIGRSLRDLCPCSEDIDTMEDMVREVGRVGQPVSRDIKHCRKDRSILEVIFCMAPLRDGDGQITGYAALCYDIGERKAEERTRQLLLDELNHRVKNTLAMVQAIAKQTIRHAQEPADFTGSFFGRIQALASAHNILTASSWQGADLGSLLREQLILSSSAGCFECSGPDFRLDPQAAVSLALVLHELATNASKYGALSGGGRVLLTWELDEGEPALNLSWQEVGGPPVSVPKRRGFGSLMIEQSLQGLDGHAELRFDPAGLVCVIRLPVRGREQAMQGSL
jgi:PAS domain S-box-containing protein